MNRFKKRLETLEGNGRYHTIGELLDSLDGADLDPTKAVHPVLAEALDKMPKWKPKAL